MKLPVPADVRQVARGFRWGARPPLPRSAEPFAPPAREREPRTAWARTPVATAARDLVQTVGFRPLVWSQVRPTVRGLDRLATVSGPVVFVANHTSHLDAPLVVGALPREWRRRTAVAAAADYFFDTWWRAVGTGLLLNTFPVERGGGRVGATPTDLLADGWSLLIFPEGTRSPDGWTGAWRQGAAYLACTANVPIVPVAIRGSYAAMPRGRGWPTPGRPAVSVTFGSPVTPDGHEPRALTRLVRAELARLLDEDASSWWASLRRASSGATPDPAGPPVADWRRKWAAGAPLEAGTPPRVWRR